jgi:ribosomal peptide maturation radical SAM protein 1
MRGPPKDYQFARCETLLVVPPFAEVYQANIACHLLQACAARRGFDVAVVYGNVIFAAMIGENEHSQLLRKRFRLEHVFKAPAFGSHAPPDTALDNEPELRHAASFAGRWLDCMADIIRAVGPRVVGCTCSFEQIASSVALLNRCKEIDPRIVTIIGGANCEGEMAEGILSLGARIDHVASGESEESFPLFLQHVLREKRAAGRIIDGTQCRDLDALPLPEYQEFFDQFEYFLGDGRPAATRLGLPHESSRGCWWGEKHHCTFCGLNGTGMAFRQKSADVLAAQLETLFARYPIRRVNMVDNIMPHKYFTSLLPRLRDTLPEGVTIFYEQKANISLQKARDLKNARISVIQPGIESLNTHILQCMDKGTTATQNIALLRYARSLGIGVNWNLLAGFPGDRRADYEEMLSLLDHIPHLEPPDEFGVLRLDRFSPYFNDPSRYGITNLRPRAAYFDVFPPHTAFDKLAYHFEGDYHCGAFEVMDVIREIGVKQEAWLRRWQGGARPSLSIAHLTDDHFVLIDSRAEGKSATIEMIDQQQAAVALAGARDHSPELVAWALERNLLVRLDGRLVPLATSSPDWIERFERSAASSPPAARSRPHVADYAIGPA